MSLWLGADFSSNATPVIKLLLLGVWVGAIALIPYSFLQGQGRPDLVAKLHVLELLPFIAILWFLLHQFGLSGAALAWSGRVAIDAALLFKVSRLRLYHLLRLVPAFILLIVAYTITQLADVSIPWSVLLAGLIFLAFAGCAVVFDAAARQMLLALRARLVEMAR